MMRDREEQGQIIPALLPAVVALIALGLLAAQVGSAAEQKTQTRTVADSAAVAAAHEVRDHTIARSSKLLPHSWAPPIFAVIPVIPLRLQATGCAAAQQNWSSNPHRSGFSCGSGLRMSLTQDGARADVRAPAGEVFEGPAEVSAARAEAFARARVVLDHCPRLAGVPRAVGNWIADQTMRSLGRSSFCFTPADAAALRPLDLKPWTAPAAVGPPNLILTAVREGMRIEIVE
jgi:hypothetical protein